MNKNKYMFRVVLILSIVVAFLFSEQGYSQNKNSTYPKRGVLDNMHQKPERWSGSKYSKQVSFAERFYISAGVGLEELGERKLLGNNTNNINANLTLGYWLAPVHGLEFKLGFRDLSYVDFIRITDHRLSSHPESTKHLSFGINYMFNLSSYASKLETPKKWEFISLVGVNVTKRAEISLGLDVGMRMQYNITPGIGVYLEPMVSVFDDKHYSGQGNMLVGRVVPSVSAGFSVGLSAINRGYKAYRHRAEASAVDGFFSEASIKVNLLHIAALAPNIGLEYYITPEWSVGLGVSVPWYHNDDKHLRYRLQLYELEGRRYLGVRKRNHLGVYFQGGLYDLKFNNIGNKGSFYGGGVSYGYLLPITKRLSIDFEVGLGYVRSKYERYEFREWYGYEHYVYINSRVTEIIAPTKVGFTLVWKLSNLRKGIR